MNAEELVKKMMKSIIEEEWNALDMVIATTILNRAAYDNLKRESPDLFELVNHKKEERLNYDAL